MPELTKEELEMIKAKAGFASWADVALATRTGLQGFLRAVAQDCRDLHVLVSVEACPFRDQVQGVHQRRRLCVPNYRKRIVGERSAGRQEQQRTDS